MRKNRRPYPERGQDLGSLSPAGLFPEVAIVVIVERMKLTMAITIGVMLVGCAADGGGENVEADAGVPDDVRGTWRLTFPEEMLASASCTDPVIPFPNSTTIVLNGSPWILSWDDREFTHHEDRPGDEHNFETSLVDTRTGERAGIFVSVSQGQDAPWATVTWLSPHPSEYCAIDGMVEVDRTY